MGISLLVVYPPGSGRINSPSYTHRNECVGAPKGERLLSSESVDGSSLSLEGVDNVEGGDGLTASVLGVGDSVTDNSLEEGLEDSTGFLVDESGDSLDTSSAGESADSGLGDSLDVIA